MWKGSLTSSTECISWSSSHSAADAIDSRELRPTGRTTIASGLMPFSARYLLPTVASLMRSPSAMPPVTTITLARFA